MPVPMLDLKAQFAAIRAEVEAAVMEVLESQQFRGGPQVEAFEREMADTLGCAHAVGVASGTDALFLLFKALDLKPGDEIITTPFTFFATAGAIVNAGARPVFADILPDTFNINPDAVAALITPRTRAFVPVHLYGQCAAMDPLLELGRRHGIPVIEDAAQAVGATRNGRSACAMGLAGALSFYPTKNLGAAGEGGMVATNDAALAEKLRMLRCHGASATYIHELVGFNSHLPAVQAAVLRVKLRRLGEWSEKRRAHAARYTAAFQEMPGVTPPVEEPGCRHVYHQYVIRLPERDAARKHFADRGVGCGVFYPVPLHRQQCFAEFAADAQCPEAERASREVLALPIYPELQPEQIDEVIAVVREHMAAIG